MMNFLNRLNGWSVVLIIVLASLAVSLVMSMMDVAGEAGDWLFDLTFAQMVFIAVILYGGWKSLGGKGTAAKLLFSGAMLFILFTAASDSLLGPDLTKDVAKFGQEKAQTVAKQAIGQIEPTGPSDIQLAKKDIAEWLDGHGIDDHWASIGFWGIVVVLGLLILLVTRSDGSNNTPREASGSDDGYAKLWWSAHNGSVTNANLRSIRRLLVVIILLVVGGVGWVYSTTSSNPSAVAMTAPTGQAGPLCHSFKDLGGSGASNIAAAMWNDFWGKPNIPHSTFKVKRPTCFAVRWDDPPILIDQPMQDFFCRLNEQQPYIPAEVLKDLQTWEVIKTKPASGPRSTWLIPKPASRVFNGTSGVKFDATVYITCSSQ